MNKMVHMKNKIIPLVIIFLNMVIMAMVMESAYYIQEFMYGKIWIFALLPITAVMGFIGMFIGKEIWYKLAFASLMVISLYFLYHQIQTIDIRAIPTDVGRINSSIMAGEDILFEDFLNTLKLMMVIGSTILSITIYIFPYNMVILDMGLLLFLWIVDYYNNSYEYVRFFVPIWAFSILFYRTTLLDREVRVFKVNRNRRLFEAVIMTLIITVASLFINIDAKGIYTDRLWNYFNGQVVTQSSINGKIIDDPFNISMSGYNNSDSILGGNIVMNEEEVFFAVGDGPIYLRGNVKTDYLGDRWSKEFQEYEPVSSITEEKIRYYEGAAGGQALSVLEIRPIREMTSNLFSSIYTRDIAFSNNLALLYYDSEFDLFTSNKTVNNNYFITYFDEEQISSGLSVYQSQTVKGENYFAQYGEYLSVSETVSQRTRDLVAGLVNDSMSDHEKASVLTEYLKTSYAYTLTPGDLPEGSDFVDHFLFENQVGYCVHFGTALTVMLRIAGVPARYVEGFKMSEEIQDGRYVVRNSDAHAWTEVLIDDGNGIWKIFDATGTPRELIFDDEPEEVDEEEVETPSETPEDEENPDPENPRDDEEVTEDEAEQRTGRNIALFIIVILSAGFGSRIAYRKWKIERMMGSESLKPYFMEINRALSFMYYTRKSGETYLEMARRMRDDELKEVYTQLVQEVYREEYSGEKGEFSRRRELYEDVYDIVKGYRGPVYAYFHKYIW